MAYPAVAAPGRWVEAPISQVLTWATTPSPWNHGAFVAGKNEPLGGHNSLELLVFIHLYVYIYMYVVYKYIYIYCISVCIYI